MPLNKLSRKYHVWKNTPEGKKFIVGQNLARCYESLSRLSSAGRQVIRYYVLIVVTLKWLLHLATSLRIIDLCTGYTSSNSFILRLYLSLFCYFLVQNSGTKFSDAREFHKNNPKNRKNAVSILCWFCANSVQILEFYAISWILHYFLNSVQICTHYWILKFKNFSSDRISWQNF